MNLTQLQQQIVSEAVKAFYAVWWHEVEQYIDPNELESNGRIDKENVKMFLTTTLNQAMRRVAEETVITPKQAVDAGQEIVDMVFAQTGFFPKNSDVRVDCYNEAERLILRLNQDSEGEPKLTPDEEEMLRRVGDEAERNWQEESVNPTN